MSTTGARSPRVFIGPVEIAGYYTRLAGALREVGVDAVAIDLGGHAFGYEQSAAPNAWVRLATRLNSRAEATRGPRVIRLWWRAASVASRVPLLAWALVRFDAFVFGFGQTLLGGRELPLLRALGKRVVVVFNGSDARPPYVDGVNMAGPRALSARACIALTRRRKRYLGRIERHADVVVSQPAFSHLFERPVVDFFRIGVPWVPAPEVEHADGPAVRVVHSPSDPAVKGSDTIRRTIDELRAEGRDLRFVELRGVPNAEVRRELARADFVIDQLYSDAPMVGVSTEAATAGRPSIVGGYAWPDLHAIYDDAAMPPVEECHPDELRAAIIRLADDRAYREALGARAKDFVTSTWDRRSIAERFLMLLRGEIDPTWLFDPRRLRYVRGVGLHEERARAIVAACIAEGGVGALQLADKPELEQAFIDFATGA
jgi:glycosyltransferase involved in cell wall biosynthesis